MGKTLSLFSVIIIFCGLTGCYLKTTDWFKPELRESPLIIAHRGGGGHWPQNSRTAVVKSIAKARDGAPEERYHGIEIDIVLTKDRVPVLSHDPWIHAELCTTAEGEAIGERILIRSVTLEELQSQYLCGGVRDRDFPQVKPKSETIMTLDEVLEELKKAPEMVLYLDVKIDGEMTARAGDYAEALAERWEKAGLPNRLYIEGPSRESLAAYRSAMGSEFVAVLSYPAFSAAEDPERTAVKARWLTKLGLRSPLARALEAMAGAVAGPTQVITWETAKEAREEGVEVILFSVNTRKSLFRYCTWPVDMLITDYPNMGHCP